MSEHVSLIRNRWRTGIPIFGVEEEGNTLSYYEVLTFDLIRSENHQVNTIITDHPVEDGSKISDHVQKEARRLSLEVQVSGTPLYQDGDENRIKDAHDALVELAESGEPVRVVTTLEDYGDMVIESYQTMVDDETGEALEVSLDLKQVSIVSPEEVEVDPSAIEEEFRASAKKREESGRQSKEEPTEEEEERGGSVLHGIFGGDD